MKNKSFLMNILICASLLLFILLLVVIFSLVKFLLPKKEINNDKEIITRTYDLNNVDNIIFDFKKTNTVFKVTDQDELKIIQNFKESKFYLNYSNKKNKITISEDFYLIDSQKKNYIIYIPKKYLNKISIVNGFGNIKINEIKNDININNNSGLIKIHNVKNINIKDVSGSINIKNVIGNVTITSSTGDITIKNMKGIIKIDSITGDIVVNNFDVTGDSTLENVSGDIILKMNNSSKCLIDYSNQNGKTKISDGICNDGINLINIKNVTGMIKIN